MPSRLFHRLRRCRVLFALALCAWLVLGSQAWAGGSCCAEMTMPGVAASGMSMSMADMASMHADGHGDQHVPHSPAHAADRCDCACTHAPVNLLLPSTLAGSPSPGQPAWRLAALAAPQPSRPPPLRPPAV